MRRRTILLATASLAYGSPNVFSVHDDLLAFPQYEVVFSDTFISDKDAESRLAYVSSSSASAQSTSAAAPDAARSQGPTGEISKRRHHEGSPHNDFEVESSIDSYESMILHGKPYLCAIPHVETPQKNETNIAQSKAEEEAELARATDRGWELLKDMEGNCMYYLSGWWSYAFCYNTNVKQFHQLPPGNGAPIFPPLEDPATPSYILGRFPNNMKTPPSKQVSDGSSSNTPPSSNEPPTTSLQVKGEVRYLVQKLSGGTTCDLTGRPRRIEIQFHCHPQPADRIAWIKEISTCSYLMVVYTPRLCNDIAFLPPRENRANPITCREVVAEPDIPDWQAQRAAEMARKLVNSGTPASRPVVGDIEVGAMKHVGEEGQRLEPPANIQPDASNAKVELLAKQDPKEKGGKLHKVSDEDLKKMGLEPALVEAARLELAEVARGKGWKLEVFDGVEGRELRGVVEGEDGEEGQDYAEEAEGYEGEYEGEEGEDVGSEEVYKDEL